MVYVISSNLMIAGNPGGPVISKGDCLLTQAGPRQAPGRRRLGNFRRRLLRAGQRNHDRQRHQPAGVRSPAFRWNVKDGSQFTDGDLLTVFGYQGTTPVTRVFEFDDNGSYDPNHTPIAFSSSDTADQMATSIADAITGDTNFDVVAAPVIQISGTARVTLTGFAATPTFTTGHTGLTVVGGADVELGRIPVAFAATDTAEMVAQEIAAAINASGLFSANAAVSQGDIVSIAASTVLFDGLALTTTRLHGRLAIDPGVIVKLEGSRIETGPPPSLSPKERRPTRSSLRRWRTTPTGRAARSPPATTSRRKLKRAIGPACTSAPSPPPASTMRASTTAAAAPRSRAATRNFDVVEVRQAKVRIADTLFENNAAGDSSTDQRSGPPRPRPGHAGHDLRARRPAGDRRQHVSQQPGPIISIDCNSLTADLVPDWGAAPD